MMRSGLFLALLFCTQMLQAKRCLQSLVFDGSDNAHAQLINLQPIDSGGYRATHNIPQFAYGDSAFIISGNDHLLKPSLTLAPAFHFFWHAQNRKVIKDKDVHVEAIRQANMEPLRAVILMSGDWFSPEGLLLEQKRRAQVPDSIPAVPTAKRFKGKPFDILGSDILRDQEQDIELFVPNNLLTISSAQKFTVGSGVRRHALPWQSYPEYFNYNIPKGVLAFESGKASAVDTKQFPQMFQIATFIMLKEATTLNHRFDQVMNYVHSPDPAHHRLYEHWGLEIIQEAQNGSGHRLYGISLEKMLEKTRFDPSKYSEKLALIQKYGDFDLPLSAAYRHSLTLREMISVDLDTSFAPIGEEGSRIRIDDRSMAFYLLSQTLLEAAGIKTHKQAYIEALNKIRTLRYVPNHPGSYSHEEFAPRSLQGNLHIQQASEKIALADSDYLPKLLFAVAEWYQEKLKVLPAAQRTLAAHTLRLSIITKSPVIIDQADKLHMTLRPVVRRTTDIADEHGNPSSTYDETNEPHFELSISFNEVLSRFSSLAGQARVQRGLWATLDLLNDPLLD